ncbi:MAG: protease SohB [Nevskia sp.]|jgi:serine protease SohB|nr:protease SohB [Nevskia sp.]MCK9385638.1 protease SohB [Nevskia sp.]
MQDLLLQYGLFLAKTLTWVGGLIVLVIVIAGLVRAGREHVGERLDVKNINERLQRMADILNLDLLDEKEYKREEKRQRAEEKAKRKASKDDEPTKPRLFVLDFDGDIEATQVAALREEISAVLQVARPEDAVMVRLESGGGIVHSYGLAASQLKRVRDHGHKLYVSVDKVAASGGYMMACVADQILAAPFAVLGSIGVVAQMPNFHRLLNKHEIDVEMHTAGEYKRTLTMFGENTDAARAKFRQELNEIHDLFKSFVAENRAALAIDRVATGEHWYGTQALELGLIDTIQTSDDFLLARVKDHDVYEIRYRVRRALREQLLSTLTRIVGFTSARLRDPAGVLHAYSAVEPFKTRY